MRYRPGSNTYSRQRVYYLDGWTFNKYKMLLRKKIMYKRLIRKKKVKQSDIHVIIGVHNVAQRFFRN